MAKLDYFGWRVSLFGKPSCFKALDYPRNNSPHTVANPDYPYRQIRKLTEAESEMSIEVLREKYPYVQPADWP